MSEKWDLFAAAAIQGILAADKDIWRRPTDLSEAAAGVADAMVSEANKRHAANGE